MLVSSKTIYEFSVNMDFEIFGIWLPFPQSCPALPSHPTIVVIYFDKGVLEPRGEIMKGEAVQKKQDINKKGREKANIYKILQTNLICTCFKPKKLDLFSA